MAPKKKSKTGKGVEGESSSSASFDRRRFWDVVAAQNYAKLLEKNMQRERGMDQTHTDHINLIRAREIGWGEFVKPPANAVMSLVREFYANLMVKHEEFHVRIRGRMVAFDTRTINSLYGMPDYDEDQYTEFMRAPYPYETVINTLCKPGTLWKLNNQRAPVTFPATSMKREAYNWYHFVASRLLPSGHVSDVTKSKAALVYCIVTGKTVDAGRVIMYSILKAARGSSTASMPHSSTITDLCHAPGVTWDESEQLLQTKGNISLEEPLPRDKRRRQLMSGPGEGSGSRPQPQMQQTPQPAAPEVRTGGGWTVHERLGDLEQLMRRQWRITRLHMDYMHDFTAVLARRFPAASTADEQFPPPPPFSHRSIEDDDEYDSNEDDELDDLEEEEDVELSGDDSES